MINITQDRLRWLVREQKHLTLDGAVEIAKGAPDLLAEIERLRAIETAARRFVTEAEDYPRYAPVKVWATPEADPYLNLRKALGDQQTGAEKS